jgi:quinol monooxygenase YgiN
MTSPLTTSTVLAVDNTTKIAPFPNPSAASWSHDDPSHSGFILNGLDDTPGRKAYLIVLEAKPGHEDAVAAFLRDINAGVNQEPGTGPWFGLRYSKTTFLIFEAFESAADRHAHDVGPGGRNFMRSEELKGMLAWPAQIMRVDVMHGKFGVLFGEKVETKAVL